MAPHRLLSVVEPADYTGELTLGRHPDGTLTFEDGVAAVEDATLAGALVTRYPNLTHGDGNGDGTDGSEDEVDPPFDPAEYSVSDLSDALDDGDTYSAEELAALRAAEVDGKSRSTALEAIDVVRGD